MFFDIGIGILLALFGATLFHWQLTLWLIIVCIIFALLPDIDMLSLASKKLNEFFGGHRGWLHTPYFHIHLSIAVGFIFGLQWMFLYSVGVLLHLVHDTLWIGNGIAWFWPFSFKRYKFFSQEHVARPGEGWIKTFYFRPNLVTIIEYGVFLVALIALLLY